MNIVINNTSMQPIYEQIVDQVKQLILTDRLAEHDPLPSVRSLAKDLRISALTVKKAYDTLEEAGFIVKVHGKGSFVASTNKELAREEALKVTEDAFEKAIIKARACSMSDDEIIELVRLLMEG